MNENCSTCGVPLQGDRAAPADPDNVCPECGGELLPRRISDRLRSSLPPRTAPFPTAGDEAATEASPESISEEGPEPDALPERLDAVPTVRQPTAAAVIKQFLEPADPGAGPTPGPDMLLGRVPLIEALFKGGLGDEDLVRAAGLLRSAFGLVLFAIPTTRDGSLGHAYRELESRLGDPGDSVCLEIRDAATASDALGHSIRGQLVFALVEAPDARNTLDLLDDRFHIDRVLAAASLRGVIAERPVRALCEACREPAEPDPEARERLRLDAVAGPFFRGVGCSRCGFSGFDGSAPIFETLSVGPSIRSMLGRGESGERVHTVARHGGQLRTFREAGIDALRQGRTSPSELARALAS